MLTGRNLAELTRNLEQRRQELTREMFASLRNVRAEDARHRPMSVEEGLGQLDVGDDLIPTIIEMKLATLNRIEEALRQIKSGRYGICAECGGQISDNRLRALPFALRCTPCEDAHETHSQSLRRSGTLRGHGAYSRNSEHAGGRC